MHLRLRREGASTVAKAKAKAKAAASYKLLAHPPPHSLSVLPALPLLPPLSSPPIPSISPCILPKAQRNMWGSTQVSWRALVAVLFVSLNAQVHTAIVAAGRAFSSNPPTYQQIQNLTQQLVAERSRSAEYERKARQFEKKLEEKELCFLQAQRQIDQLKGNVATIKRQIAAMKRPFRLYKQAYDDGLTADSEVYDGFNYGTASERSQKSQTVKKAVGDILSGAGGSKFKAAEIIAKILKHPKLELAVQRCEDPKEQDLKDTIIKELLASLANLKHSRANSEKWHAYKYILHAVIPAQCPHPDRCLHHSLVAPLIVPLLAPLVAPALSPLLIQRFLFPHATHCGTLCTHRALSSTFRLLTYRLWRTAQEPMADILVLDRGKETGSPNMP
jgi:hypothetical protein